MTGRAAWDSDFDGTIDTTITTLDSGTLGTIQTTDDSTDFRIEGVTTDETQPITEVDTFPSSATGFNADYAWNDRDWYREWNDSAQAVDVVITINWDTDSGSRPGDLTLDYAVRGPL